MVVFLMRCCSVAVTCAQPAGGSSGKNYPPMNALETPSPGPWPQ